MTSPDAPSGGPVPIGLTGLMGAGKDTAFGFIREWADERLVLARRRSFADALKLSFARIFLPDCSVDEAVMWCNEIKWSGDLSIAWGQGDEKGTFTEIKHTVSGRTALQRHGTEGHRDVFGDNFWVDILFPLSSVSMDGGNLIEMQYPRNFMGPLDQESPDICVAADERFDNEAKRVKTLQGYNLLIVRPAENDGLEQEQHVSEAGVSHDLIDWSIRNDGDLDKFRADVRQFCDVVLAPRLNVQPEKEWPLPWVDEQR